MTLKIGVGQRRARLGRRHHLASPAGSVEEAADGVVVLHATDPATVYLSARARRGSTPVAELEAALYDERTLVRLLGMRRTMFVGSRDVAALVQAGCSADIAVKQRRLLVQQLGQQGHPEN